MIFLSFDNILVSMLNYYVAFSVIGIITYYSLENTAAFNYNKSMRKMISIIVALVIGAWLGDIMIQYEALKFIY